MIKEHFFETKKTARFYQIGSIDDNTETIWFVLHGYKQLAKYFIRQFCSLNDKKNVVVAPEGFHRFYLNGYSGRVGASWMTAEDRLNDIKDYVRFLDELYLSFRITENITVNLIGFSQGGATASRWAGYGTSRIDNLILWGGVFPPDMDFDKGKFKNKIRFLVGTKDEFISSEKLEEYKKQLQKQRVDYELVMYDGSHKIYDEPLIELKQRLK